LVIAGTLGLGLQAVIVALAAVHWTEYARVVRNMTMVERSKPTFWPPRRSARRHGA